MAKRGGAMHVTTTRRHYKDKTYETHLLRRSYREDGKVKNETLANLSHLPAEVIDVVRRSLKGERFVAAADAFDIDRSLPHGHVAAVWVMAQTLGFPALVGPACRERDLAVALIVSRVVEPASKLATSRGWSDTTLGPDLGVAGASTDEVYAAMDWLVGRQNSIEAALAARHLEPGGLVLYDLSSSYVEGRHCELAARGYSRDQKRGKEQIEYGLVTDIAGRPVAIEVFAGNTADPAAFVSAAATVKDRFGLDDVVMVGDRGMITSARIDALKHLGGLGWITALRAPQIQTLAADDGPLQLGLFDQTNLAEITHPDYPDERLIACRNPTLATERARKRVELLAATETELDKIVAAVDAGRLTDPAKIGLRVGRVANRYKMAKHFTLDITEASFTYHRLENAIATEAALDGVYVIRTSVTGDALTAPQLVEAYKALSNVEAAFRSLKSVDLELRPIHHRRADRVRAHALVCMLAEYLVWHLRRVWAPLTFTDEQPPTRHDPVAKAQRSQTAATKASRRRIANGDTAHSFATLLTHLATLTRDTISFHDPDGVTIEKLATPTPTQRKAFELIGTAPPLNLT
jgi:hypothetical protein